MINAFFAAVMALITAMISLGASINGNFKVARALALIALICILAFLSNLWSQ